MASMFAPSAELMAIAVHTLAMFLMMATTAVIVFAYGFRVGISNSRMVKLENHEVDFWSKGNKTKQK